MYPYFRCPSLTVVKRVFRRHDTQVPLFASVLRLSARSLNRSALIAFENMVEVLLEGNILFLFPLGPLFRPVARFTTSHALVGRKRRRASGALARCPRILHHSVEHHAEVAVFIHPCCVFLAFLRATLIATFATLTAEAVMVNSDPMASAPTNLGNASEPVGETMYTYSVTLCPKPLATPVSRPRTRSFFLKAPSAKGEIQILGFRLTFVTRIPHLRPVGEVRRPFVIHTVDNLWIKAGW
jgi:hypothetical protein